MAFWLNVHDPVQHGYRNLCLFMLDQEGHSIQIKPVGCATPGRKPYKEEDRPLQPVAPFLTAPYYHKGLPLRLFGTLPDHLSRIPLGRNGTSLVAGWSLQCGDWMKDR